MEANVLIDDELGNSSELIINQSMKINLLETAKWGKFLSIVGFIMIGLMLIFGLTVSYFFNKIMSVNPAMEGLDSGYSSMLASMYSGLFLISAVIHIFPTLYLFRFSTFILREKNGNNIENYQIAFENLKRLFKFFGILTAVVLSIYALVILFAIIGGLSAFL